MRASFTAPVSKRLAMVSREPWICTVSAIEPRDVPGDILARLRDQPDIVEELSDYLRARFNLESSVDFAGHAVAHVPGVLVGPVVTVRYAPKCVPSDEQRLGHDRIAAALPPGAIIVTDSRDCAGSVLGGNAAGIMRAAGACAVIVEGVVRDVPEIDASGLAIVARSRGIVSGRPTAQAVQIGGQITHGGRLVTSGDIAILNAAGMVCIPAWLAWADVRRLFDVAPK